MKAIPVVEFPAPPFQSRTVNKSRRDVPFPTCSSGVWLRVKNSVEPLKTDMETQKQLDLSCVDGML